MLIIAQTVVAQESATEEAGRTIMLLVLALLVIAVLLAALTFWYWRHTDPKRRAARVAAAAGVEVMEGAVAGDAVVAAGAEPGSIWLEEPPATITETAEHRLAEDDWLSLTAPEPRTLPKD